jgi:Putative phage tail protein
MKLNKRLKTMLLTSVAFSLVSTPALADPVSVGTLVLTGVNALLSAGGLGTIAGGATVFGSVTVASLVGTTVLTAASIGISSLLSAGKPSARSQQAIDPGGSKQTLELGNSGQLRAVGRVRMGGVVAFGNTAAFDRYRVVARCKGPIDAIENYLFGGREVTVEPNGDVSSPPFTRPGGSYINIQNQLGYGAEVAWADVISAFPTLWSADHRGRGIFQSRIKYISPGVNDPKYLKIFGSGFPDSQIDIRGELIFDPRDGGTRWSDNGILVALHVLLREFSYENSWFDMAFIGAEATKADQILFTRTGTEKRSRCWGVWEDQSVSRIELLSQILLSAGAEIVTLGNDLIGIRLVDDVRPAERVFASRWIVRADLKTGPEGVERPNVCKVRYYSPERNYELAEIPLVRDATVPAPLPLSWARVQSEVDAHGEREVTYSLPFCPSASQAQRIARRLFATARAETGIITTNMAGVGTWGIKTAAFEFDELGETLVCEINPARIDEEAGTVEIPVVVIPTLAPFDPNQDEALPPFDIPELGFVPTVAQPPGIAEITRVTPVFGGVTNTRVSYAPVGDIGSVEATYRTSSAGIFGPWTSMQELELPPLYYAFVPFGLFGNFQFRYRVFNSEGEGSIWSPVTEITVGVNNAAPNAPSIVVNVATVQGVGEVATVFVSGPTSIQIASMVFGGPNALPEAVAAPLQSFTWTYVLPAQSNVPQVFTWTAQSRSSNGTGSSVSQAQYTLPAI